MRCWLWFSLLIVIAAIALQLSIQNLTEEEKEAKVVPRFLFSTFMTIGDWIHRLQKFNTGPWRIMDLSYNFWTAQVLRAVAEFEIADIIHEKGPCTCSELTRYIHQRQGHKLDSEKLCRVMKAAATFDTFEREPNSHDPKFSNNGNSDVLRNDHPFTMRYVVLAWAGDIYRSFYYLPESLKTNQTGFKVAYGEEMWDYYSKHEDHSTTFQKHMHQVTRLGELIVRYDYPHWNKYSVVCDIGGGAGRMLSGIMKQYPNFKKGYLLELPYIIEKSKQRVERDEPLDVQRKMNYISGSFFNLTGVTQLQECDLFLLVQIIHDFNDEDSIKIVQNVRSQMKNASMLLIIGGVLDRSQNPIEWWKRGGDINMLVTLNGRERSEYDYRNLAAKTGFEVRDIYHTRSAYYVTEFLKKNE